MKLDLLGIAQSANCAVYPAFDLENRHGDNLFG